MFISKILRNALPRFNPAKTSTRCFSLEAESRVRNITLIPGDGVGPEISHSAQQILNASGAPLNFEVFNLSEINFNSADFLATVENIKKNKVCLKGVLVTSPHSESNELDNINFRLRKSLDLFASTVSLSSLPGLQCKYGNLDIAVIRESTEGEYSCIEHECVPGVVESSKIVTMQNSMRIAKYAFDYATRYNRKSVTAIHKANIMKLADGLFLESCTKISKLYPKIEFQHMIVDNACMQFASNPSQFDVIVTPNLYGNILANLGAGLVGGAGVVGGSNVGHDCICFEPGARHSYAEAAGRNIANPTAMIRASYHMLQHLRLYYEANMIRNALKKVVSDKKVLTRDMGGNATTSQFTKAVINNLKH